jgi:hypothetical protein
MTDESKPETFKIEIEVSRENEMTSFPWWMIVRPSARRGPRSVAMAITGPFFSREEATKELESRRYHYGPKAIVWCASGCYSGSYKRALREAAAKEGVSL